MTINALQGTVELEVTSYPGMAPQVHIAHHYPDLSGRLFQGMTAGRLMDSLPRFYALCSTAQGICAGKALENITGHSTPHSHKTARELLLAVENIQEHLWRFFIEWPAYLGEGPGHTDIVAIKSWLPTLHRALYTNADPLCAGVPQLHVESALLQCWYRSLCDLLERQVFSSSACNWLARDCNKLVNWWHDSDTLLARLLRYLDQQGLARLCDVTPTPLPELENWQLAEVFHAGDDSDRGVLPIWRDRPMETSALTRQLDHPVIEECAAVFGYGLQTRLLARAVEVAEACLRCGELVNTLCWQRHDIEQAPVELPSGIGYAQVEAARGRLLHRVEMDQGMVQNYAILPSTCWNFHPEGIVKQCLQSLGSVDSGELQQVAKMLVKLVDPCVSHSIKFRQRGDQFDREYA